MKRTFLLILSILLLGIPINAQKKVAIYIKNTSCKNNYGAFGIGASHVKDLTSLLINDLLQTDNYLPIERDADFLSAIEKEYDYQISGEVPESQIINIGRKYGAKIVISGKYSFCNWNYDGDSGSRSEASLRAIDVETGRIISSVSENDYKKGYFKEKLSEKFINGFPIQYSSSPKHLSLCVTKDGKRFYIKPSQWETMSERKKEDYNIMGICIMTDGEAFIMSLRDSGKGDWDYAKANNVLSLTQMQLIGSLKYEINKSLEIFGGNLPKPRSEEFYWTSSEIDSGKAWGITTNNEPKKYKKKTSGLIRKGWNL